MSKKFDKKTYKKELFLYQDLTQLVLQDVVVTRRYSPKLEPEYLNGSSWKCNCTKCGKERQISGLSLLKQSYKNCSCSAYEDSPELEETGRGLMYMREHEPDAFTEYLKRKERESKSNNCSQYIFTNRNNK